MKHHESLPCDQTWLRVTVSQSETVDGLEEVHQWKEFKKTIDIKTHFGPLIRIKKNTVAIQIISEEV